MTARSAKSHFLYKTVNINSLQFKLGITDNTCCFGTEILDGFAILATTDTVPSQTFDYGFNQN